MTAEPKKPSARNLAWLLLGGCVGAAGYLYIKKQRSQPQKTTPGGSSEKSLRMASPQPGDILLFHNAKGLNRLITLFTGSPFYHAGLYAGENRTVEARTSGVVRGDLRGREADYVVAPAPEGKGDAALAWAKTQIGDGYDELDVLVIVLDRLSRFLHFNYTSRNRYSCGEFIAIAFEKAGIRLVPERAPEDVVPGDLARFVPPAQRANAK